MDFFSKMPNLKVIDISHNNLDNSDDHEFSGYYKLIKLNMSHNKMTTLNVWLPADIPDIPIVYDRLRFDDDPMPLSKHTLQHYDNASVLRRT